MSVLLGVHAVVAQLLSGAADCLEPVRADLLTELAIALQNQNVAGTDPIAHMVHSDGRLLCRHTQMPLNI